MSQPPPELNAWIGRLNDHDPDERRAAVDSLWANDWVQAELWQIGEAACRAVAEVWSLSVGELDPENLIKAVMDGFFVRRRSASAGYLRFASSHNLWVGLAGYLSPAFYNKANDRAKRLCGKSPRVELEMASRTIEAARAMLTIGLADLKTGDPPAWLPAGPARQPALLECVVSASPSLATLAFPGATTTTVSSLGLHATNEARRQGLVTTMHLGTPTTRGRQRTAIKWRKWLTDSIERIEPLIHLRRIVVELEAHYIARATGAAARLTPDFAAIAAKLGESAGHVERVHRLMHESLPIGGTERAEAAAADELLDPNVAGLFADRYCHDQHEAWKAAARNFRKALETAADAESLPYGERAMMFRFHAFHLQTLLDPMLAERLRFQTPQFNRNPSERKRHYKDIFDLMIRWLSLQQPPPSKTPIRVKPPLNHDSLHSARKRYTKAVAEHVVLGPVKAELDAARARLDHCIDGARRPR